MTRVIAATLAAGIALSLSAPAAHAQDARSYYRDLSTGEVRDIEYDLIWVGATDAVTNGVLGRRDIEAIRQFEASVGGNADGILNQRERRRLERRARRARAAAGYEVEADPRTGARVGVPGAYIDTREPTRNGTRWTAADGSVVLRTVRAPNAGNLRNFYLNQFEQPNREIGYEVFRDDFFVVSGTQGRKRFYVRAATDGNEVRVYSLAYDPEAVGDIEPVIVAMSNDFDPFASDPGGTPPRSEPIDPVDPVVGPATRCGQSYDVRRGDTFYKIALRCGVTVPALRRANPGIRARELAVGQVLNVPLSRMPAGPSGAPSVALASAAPTPGGRVTVVLSGFAPGAVVEGGFARNMRRVPVERVLRTDNRGMAEFNMRLPERFSPGDRVLLAFFDANGQQSADVAFTVRRPAPPRQQVSVVGMVTSEGQRCQAMRGANGKLYTLVDLAGDVSPGMAVRVTGLAGTPAQNARCEQGTTIQVGDIVQR